MRLRWEDVAALPVSELTADFHCVTKFTVPGIRYVIDSGTARISRYSPRSKTQRLPIEPISQASALPVM